MSSLTSIQLWHCCGNSRSDPPSNEPGFVLPQETHSALNRSDYNLASYNLVDSNILNECSPTPNHIALAIGLGLGICTFTTTVLGVHMVK